MVGRLDMVDKAMLSFFQPAAEKVMSSADPTNAMAAALAALSGIKEIPKPRSLLAQVCSLLRARASCLDRCHSVPPAVQLDVQ